MKKITLILLLVLTFNTNAQVTELFLPTDYFSPQTTNPGSSFTLCQKNGFLYVAARDVIGNGKLFKINQETNATIPILESSPFTLLYNNDITFLGEYNDKIFFLVYGYGISMLDTVNNTFTTNYLGVSNIAGFTGMAIFNGHIYNGYGQKKNIETGIITDITYFDGSIYQTINISEYTVIGNEMIAIGTISNTPSINKLFKFDSLGNTFILQNNATTASTLAGEQKFFKLNNNYIYVKNDEPTKLISLPDNSSIEQNLLIGNTNDSFFSLFKLANNLYFYHSSDGNYIKKTDGISSQLTSLVANSSFQPFGNNRFSSRNNEFSNFLEHNNKVYSFKYDGSGAIDSPRHLISFDGNNTQYIGDFSELTGAITHNGQLFFQALTFDNTGNWYNGIFRYDGNFLYRLNLGSIDGSINTYRGQILAYNNYLFFANNTSVVKIDLNTISSNLYVSNFLNSESYSLTKLIFSPNPTQSQITFEQEVSGLEIFDVSGKKVKKFENNNATFDVSDLQKGIYFLKGKTIENNNFIEKLIKE